MLRTSDNVHVISKDLYVPLKRKCYSQILPLWLSIPLTFTKSPVVLHFKITCSFMASKVSEYTFSAVFFYTLYELHVKVNNFSCYLSYFFESFNTSVLQY